MRQCVWVRSLRHTFVGGLCLALLAGCLGESDDDGDGHRPAPTVAIISVLEDSPEGRVHFTAKSENLGSRTLRWEFGDGVTATGETQDHDYVRGGDFSVKLSALEANGDVAASATQTVTVRFMSHVAGRTCEPGTGWCWQGERITAHDLVGSSMADAQNGWAHGYGGTVVRTGDGGLNWQAMTNAGPGRVTDLRFINANRGWALAGDDSGVRLLYSEDGGTQWTSVGPVPVSLSNSTFAIAEPGRLILKWGLISKDEGGTWIGFHTPGEVMVSGPVCWILGSQTKSIMRAPACEPGDEVDVTPPESGLRPGSQTFVSAKFLSPTEGFAWGYGDDAITGAQTYYVWSTQDGGGHWARAALSGERFFPGAVQMTEAAGAWALDHETWVDDPGLSTLILVRSVNGGQDWSRIPLPDGLAEGSTWSGRLVTASALEATLTQNNVLGRTRDGGKTWQVVTVPGEDADMNSREAGDVLQWSDDGNGIVVRFSGRIYSTQDGGTSWTQVVGSRWADLRISSQWDQHIKDEGLSYTVATAAHFANASEGFYALASGAVVGTTDGGRTWRRTDTAVSHPTAVLRLWFPEPSGRTGWMLRDNALWKTVDNGVHWAAPATRPALAIIRGMAWTDLDHGWLTNGYSFLVTDDGGESWHTREVMIDGYLRRPVDVAFVDKLHGVFSTRECYYGEGCSDHFFRTENGGVDWVDTGFVQDVTDRLVVAGGLLWSLGYRPAFSADGGAHWTRITAADWSCKDVTFPDAEHGWMACGHTVIATEDGGATWSAPQRLSDDISPTTIVMTDKYTGWLITSGAVLATGTGGH